MWRRACFERGDFWDLAFLRLCGLLPLWPTDIDGTITKSDMLGHAAALVGTDWTHVGVASLFSDIAANGYKFLYLSSRSISQAVGTRGECR